MKQHNSRQPVDEREKLRKFRELDDAFAEALRSLDASDDKSGGTSDASVRELDGQERDAAIEPQDEKTRQRLFEERLTALMSEYAQPAEHVSRLLQTLKSLGHIA
ncbi:hypothetical protein ABE957_12565 [Halomonas sp. CS7]|uniref:DUF4404 family protein n=1 Tax=Halomonas pelophila TaxID=3151122 RepID=A0ABV1N722_9GAMM